MIYLKENSEMIISMMKSIDKKINYLYYFDVDNKEELVKEYDNIRNMIFEKGYDGTDRITGKIKNNLSKVDSFDEIVSVLKEFEEKIDQALNNSRKYVIKKCVDRIKDLTEEKELTIEAMWDKLKVIIEVYNNMHASIIEDDYFKNKVAYLIITILEKEITNNMDVNIYRLFDKIYNLNDSNIINAIISKIRELYIHSLDYKKVYLEKLIITINKEIYIPMEQLVKEYLNIFALDYNSKKETIIDKVRRTQFDFTDLVNLKSTLTNLYGKFNHGVWYANDTLAITGTKVLEGPCKYLNVKVYFDSYSCFSNTNNIIGLVTNKKKVSSILQDFTNLEYFITLDNTAEIGINAFDNSPNKRPMKLEYVRLGKNVLSIGEKAFSCCYNLKEVHFDEKLRSIGYESFSNTDLSGDIILPEGIKTVSAHAFDGTRVDNVVIGNNCKIEYRYTGRKPQVNFVTREEYEEIVNKKG